MNPTREWAIEELRRMVLDALGEHDAAVWLFGPCARDNLLSGFFGELDADIEESTIPYDVDLVDLRNADPVLIAEILHEGIPWRE
jgi:hypothetical protein